MSRETNQHLIKVCFDVSMSVCELLQGAVLLLLSDLDNKTSPGHMIIDQAQPDQAQPDQARPDQT